MTSGRFHAAWNTGSISPHRPRQHPPRWPCGSWARSSGSAPSPPPGAPGSPPDAPSLLRPGTSAHGCEDARLSLPRPSRPCALRHHLTECPREGTGPVSETKGPRGHDLPGPEGPLRPRRQRHALGGGEEAAAASARPRLRASKGLSRGRAGRLGLPCGLSSPRPRGTVPPAGPLQARSPGPRGTPHLGPARRGELGPVRTKESKAPGLQQTCDPRKRGFLPTTPQAAGAGPPHTGPSAAPHLRPCSPGLHPDAPARALSSRTGARVPGSQPSRRSAARLAPPSPATRGRSLTRGSSRPSSPSSRRLAAASPPPGAPGPAAAPLPAGHPPAPCRRGGSVTPGSSFSLLIRGVQGRDALSRGKTTWPEASEGPGLPAVLARVLAVSLGPAAAGPEPCAPAARQRPGLKGTSGRAPTEGRSGRQDRSRLAVSPPRGLTGLLLWSSNLHSGFFKGSLLPP